MQAPHVGLLNAGPQQQIRLSYDYTREGTHMEPDGPGTLGD